MISEVKSMKNKVLIINYEVWNTNFEVWTVTREVWSVNEVCLFSVKYKPWGVKYVHVL